MVTTIQLEGKLKHKLEELKIHPRETYSKVIDRLIKNSIGEEGLSPQTIRHIELSLENIKKGRVYSTNEVKKKLRIR